MVNKEDNELNDLLDLLSPAASNSADSARTEPLTYHRRGHWFKSSIAHHKMKLKKPSSDNLIGGLLPFC
ncbi:hypothetical protein ACFLTK_02455 [Chloroflexota bacterium]